MTCDSEQHCEQARDDLREAEKRIAELEYIVSRLAGFDGREVMMVELLDLVARSKAAVKSETPGAQQWTA